MKVRVILSQLNAEQAAALTAAVISAAFGGGLKLLDYVLGRQRRSLQGAHERLTSVQELSGVIDTLHDQIEFQQAELGKLRAEKQALERRVDQLEGRDQPTRSGPYRGNGSSTDVS